MQPACTVLLCSCAEDRANLVPARRGQLRGPAASEQAGGLACLLRGSWARTNSGPGVEGEMEGNESQKKERCCFLSLSSNEYSH